MKVKTYSVNTFDAWLQTEGDDTAGAYVKYEDYAALAAECEALRSAIEFAEPWLPSCDEELLHRIEMVKQTPATVLALLDELEAKDKRIAELEAREVVLPRRISMEGGSYCTAHARYDEEGDFYYRDEVIESLVAAGIRINGEM